MARTTSSRSWRSRAARCAALILLASVCVAGCSRTPAGPLAVTSPAFKDGERIPAVYTCDGPNLSPPLVWGKPPDGTVSVALVMDDPDAGGWVHWVVFNLPGWTERMPEGAAAGVREPAGGTRGQGNAGLDYAGPCPPHGDGPHRYSFRVYALDAWMQLTEGATREDLLRAMDGHIIAQGELTGLYSRQAAEGESD